MAEPRFVHLRVHSDYSMIDGLAKTGPLVKKAAALGMPALAITDFDQPVWPGEVLRNGPWRGVKTDCGGRFSMFRANYSRTN